LRCRILIAVAAVTALAALRAPAQKSAPKAPPPKPAAAAKTPAKSSGKTAARPSAKTPAAKAPARARRSAQTQPTQQRYREIQQALADKGFFSGPVDGQWGPESVEALKRFQREQRLPDDGKIGSLSLIALGLGSPQGVIPQAALQGR
jgi:peptidoglycan hydrolase-like protein with peptidoglycan-binding domain